MQEKNKNKNKNIVLKKENYVKKLIPPSLQQIYTILMIYPSLKILQMNCSSHISSIYKKKNPLKPHHFNPDKQKSITGYQK